MIQNTTDIVDVLSGKKDNNFLQFEAGIMATRTAHIKGFLCRGLFETPGGIESELLDAEIVCGGQGKWKTGEAT